MGETRTLPRVHPLPMPDYIFVFGSNLAGIHGAGAAKCARLEYGAEPGIGKGPTGRAYAIPTKDVRLRPLPLASIRNYVFHFILYANENKQDKFWLTPVGCGLAGYSPSDIGPMFARAPLNVHLPKEFLPYV